MLTHTSYLAITYDTFLGKSCQGDCGTNSGRLTPLDGVTPFPQSNYPHRTTKRMSSIVKLWITIALAPNCLRRHISLWHNRGRV